MTSKNTVTILYNGYSRMSEDDDNVMFANCTCTLIQTPNASIIVDTMTPWNRNDILEALQKHSISVNDVAYVVSTHGHSDHLGNNNLFLSATHIVGHVISHKDQFKLHDFLKDPFELADGVWVHATPGHTITCVSVFVEHTEHGRVVVAGDLFEKQEDIDDSQLWLEAGSENPVLQRQNRSKVAQWADVIVPGHGGSFNVTADMRHKLLLASTGI